MAIASSFHQPRVASIWGFPQNTRYDRTSRPVGDLLLEPPQGEDHAFLWLITRCVLSCPVKYRSETQEKEVTSSYCLLLLMSHATALLILYFSVQLFCPRLLWRAWRRFCSLRIRGLQGENFFDLRSHHAALLLSCCAHSAAKQSSPGLQNFSP